MPKTFLYARVSSEEQRKDGYSLPKQVKKLKAYAKAMNLEADVELLEDESAKDGRNRKLFNKMLKEIQDSVGQEYIILCEKVDRLQRNFEDAQEIDELVKEGKLTIHFSDDVPHLYDRTANSHTKLMFGFKTLLAKFYIDLLREECIKGTDEKVAQGGWHSIAPIGYRNNKILRTVEVDNEVIGNHDETRAELVKQFFELYASGKYDVRRLAKEMASRGLVSKHGNPVGKSCIANALKNPFFYGIVTHPRTKELIPGLHSAIVNKKLWDKCQTARQQKTAYKHSRRMYKFRDIFKCSYCGCSIIGEPKRKKLKDGGVREHIYYHCSYGSPKLGRNCPQPWWKEQRLEELVLMSLKDVFADDFILDFLRKDMDMAFEKEQEFIEAEKKRLNTEYSRNEKQMKQLYIDKNAHVIPVAWFMEEFGKLRDRQEAIREELSRLDEEIEEFMEKGMVAIELGNDLENQYLSSDMENKNNLLKILYRTVKIDESGLDISWSPGWDELVKLKEIELGQRLDRDFGKMVDGRGLEPPASAVRTLRSPN